MIAITLVSQLLLLSCQSDVPARPPVDWHDKQDIGAAVSVYDEAQRISLLRETFRLQDPDGKVWPVMVGAFQWTSDRSRLELLYPTSYDTAEVLAPASVAGKNIEALVGYHFTYAPFREGRKKSDGDFITTDIHLHSIGDTAFYRYVQDGDYFRREPIPAPTP